MKAHKVELLIIDHDQVGPDCVQHELQHANYGNDCINPIVRSVETIDIGEWHDDHPLNKKSTFESEYDRLFNKVESHDQ